MDVQVQGASGAGGGSQPAGSLVVNGEATRGPSPPRSVSSKSTGDGTSVGASSTRQLAPKGAASVPSLKPAPANAATAPTWHAWAKRVGLFLWLCAALYTFLACLGLMGSAFKVLTGRTAGDLFSVISNPVAAATVGVLATTALQSSSTTTSITVALVASDAMTVGTAIYVIMGANIGTSVTNTIVAVGQAHMRRNFVRALSGATVHDMFNILTVIVLLPLEAATGVLETTTAALVAPLSDGSSGTFKSPLKTLVDPLVKAILEPDKKKLTQIAHGEVVEGSIVKSGLFHDAGWSDDAAGAVSLTVSLVVLMVALAMMVKGLGYAVGNGGAASQRATQRAAGVSDEAAAQARARSNAAVRWLRRAATSNGYVAILVGALVTIVVQSSSVTTSALTPLVGTGVITLEQMLPLTLGANLGTTTTALLAALATPKVGGVQIALAHLMFNLVGILMWYPVPKLRKVPLDLARWMGKVVAVWRPAALLYLFVTFFAGPALLLAASELMGEGPGATVLGVFLLLLFVSFFVAVVYWWRKWGTPAYERQESQLAELAQQGGALELVVVGTSEAATDNDASSTGDEGEAAVALGRGGEAVDPSDRKVDPSEAGDELDMDAAVAAASPTCLLEAGKCVGSPSGDAVATCVRPAAPAAAPVVGEQHTATAGEASGGEEGGPASPRAGSEPGVAAPASASEDGGDAPQAQPQLGAVAADCCTATPAAAAADANGTVTADVSAVGAHVGAPAAEPARSYGDEALLAAPVERVVVGAADVMPTVDGAQ